MPIKHQKRGLLFRLLERPRRLAEGEQVNFWPPPTEVSSGRISVSIWPKQTITVVDTAKGVVNVVDTIDIFTAGELTDDSGDVLAGRTRKTLVDGRTLIGKEIDAANLGAGTLETLRWSARK